MDASDFAATVIRRQHELVVELKGELDAASGPTLTTAIADIEHDDASRLPGISGEPVDPLPTNAASPMLAKITIWSDYFA